jgi:hypothetical protein
MDTRYYAVGEPYADRATPGKARVVIFARDFESSPWIDMNALVDGIDIGMLEPHGFVDAEVDPGEHSVALRCNKVVGDAGPVPYQAATVAALEGGKTYHFEATCENVVLNPLKLMAMDAAAATAAVGTCHRAAVRGAPTRPYTGPDAATINVAAGNGIGASTPRLVIIDGSVAGQVDAKVREIPLRLPPGRHNLTIRWHGLSNSVAPMNFNAPQGQYGWRQRTIPIDCAPGGYTKVTLDYLFGGDLGGPVVDLHVTGGQPSTKQ